MPTDILANIINYVWDEKMVPLYKNHWKNIIAGSFIAGAGYIGYKETKKAMLWNYLNWKIPDTYNPEELTKHVWISGAQGSGKSNKLRRIFINSFVKQGWGGIYIDTHGTADFVLQSIPEERWKDVIYIAPWMERVWGINILKRYENTNDEVDRIAADVVDVFHKMYPRSWGDKLANAIRFATKMVLIAEQNSGGKYTNPTLIDVYRVLTDEIFRNKLRHWVDNDIITNFLDSMKGNSAASKLEDPLSSENILLFLCQEEGLDMLQCMEERKIIICNLDNDRLSTTANLMAGIIISVITQCAAKRKETANHPYFAVALDEYYEYANKHIRVLIEQMRKKNICMLLCNQHREQLPSKDIKSAVSMCQFKFIHTPADEDLGWLSRVYGRWFTKDQLSSIPYFSCIHDEHNSGKSRKPVITRVPYYKGDHGWDYVKEMKYMSLRYAPDRYKMLNLIKKRMSLQIMNDGDQVRLDGKIIYEDAKENNSSINMKGELSF